MERYITFADLPHEHFYSTVIECHKQIWPSLSRWSKYRLTPRFADGLIIICSDIEVTYHMENGREIRGCKGDVLYAPKGVCYTAYFRNGGSDTDIYTINFNLCDPDGNELRLGNTMQKLFSEKHPDIYHTADKLNHLCLEHKNDHLKKQACFLSLMDSIVERICQHSEDYYPIRHGVELFLREWDKNEKISYYAEICGLSTSCFYQHFKSWAGIPPLEYRNRIRISAAKSLLQYSTLSVQDIAYKVGFSDQFYFSRMFKKITGISPQKFRK